MPCSWQKEMEPQGFDPMNKTTNEVLELMEHCEASEDFNANAKVKTKSKSNTKKKRTLMDKDNSKEVKYCSHHGENYSHTSEQCFVLHPVLKKKGKNKTWARKASENKSKAKLDLAAFIKQAVKKGAKNSLKAQTTKKRKEASEAESDDDLNAFDPKDFNYEDMDNLKIDSDDEISI